jgi:N-acetyl-anhydromuramyl-L-alanine amidase AmpD
MTKDMVVLHHSAIPFNRSQVIEIKRSHLNNSKIKQPIAYHYLIERVPDGQIVQCHEEEYIGHHAGNDKVNVRSIGVCVCGDFTWQLPTDEQIRSLARLLREIQLRWGIPDENIKLHSQVRLSPTACPAIDLREFYFAQRQKDLALRLERLQAAKNRATGQRLVKITRILDRLMQVP